MSLETEVAVIGGGVGGVAAALALLERGHRVVLTEEHPWLGGQLTSQAVPPDEHIWVEQFGVTARYRALRDGIRRYYRDHYPLSEQARADRHLNPGRGRVSRLCHEPRVAVAVIDQLLAPYRSNGRLVVLQQLERAPADLGRAAVAVGEAADRGEQGVGVVHLRLDVDMLRRVTIGRGLGDEAALRCA